MNRVKSILEFLFGLVMILISIWSLNNMVNSAIGGLLAGIGGVALVSSIINIRRYFFLSKDELSKINKEKLIESTDERNRFIKYKSAYITEKIMTLILSIYLIYLALSMSDIKFILPIGIYLILGLIVNRIIVFKIEKEV